MRDDTVSHIPAETSDRRSRHASSRDSEIIARRLSTGTAVNRRHASVQKSATHAQKDKEKENLGNPVLGQEPRRDPDDARRAGLSGLAGGDIVAGRRMSTYVGRCITRSPARSVIVTRATRTQLCARKTSGLSRGPRENTSRWFEPRHFTAAGGVAATSAPLGMYDPPASPGRFRYPAPLDEDADDEPPTTPGGDSLFTTTANPLTKPPLKAFAGSWAQDAPRSPLKRAKVGSDDAATPTKLTKSPARRRVLSDLYGRLTVATERAPSGEDVASTEQGTDATGETGGERGSQRRACAPLRVACRPPRRSEDRPKVIQLLTPVSAARLAEDFAGLPSPLSVPW